MHLLRSVATGLVLVVSCSVVLAQQTTKKDSKPAKTETKAAQSNAMQTPKPSPEIIKLAKTLNGNWKVSGKILDESWSPGGDEGAGTDIVHAGPGGFTSLSMAKMSFKKMGKFAGHGVVWWDDTKKAYQGLWCDNWGPTCAPTGDGKWEGENLVFTGEMQMGPQKMPVRQTYSNITVNSFDWKMEVGDGKGGWKPEMSLKYERAEAAKSADAAPKQ